MSNSEDIMRWTLFGYFMGRVDERTTFDLKHTEQASFVEWGMERAQSEKLLHAAQIRYGTYFADWLHHRELAKVKRTESDADAARTAMRFEAEERMSHEG